MELQKTKTMNLKPHGSFHSCGLALLCIYICFPTLLFSQFDIEWDKTIGGSGWEELNAITTTSDGGYLFAGTTFSNESHDVTHPSFGGGDFWIVKTDEQGNIQWNKRYGGDGWDRVWDVQETLDGGFIVGGETDSSQPGNLTDVTAGVTDYLVTKLYPNGDLEWSRAYGGSGSDTLFGVWQLQNEDFILAGFSNSEPNSISGVGERTAELRGKADFWVLRVNKFGDVIWDESYGGDEREQLFYLTMNSTNTGMLLGGSSESGISGNKTDFLRGLNDMWLVQIDFDGNIDWQKTYGGNGEETIQEILIMRDGGYLLMGQSSSTDVLWEKKSPNYGHWDYWVVKVDQNGVLEWENTYGGSATDLAYTAYQNCFGNVLLAGVSGSPSSSISGVGNRTSPLIGDVANDCWLLYLTETGDIIWDHAVGGGNIEAFTEFRKAHDGGFIMGGHSSSGISQYKSDPSRGLNDFWIVKSLCPIAPPGLDDISGICVDDPIAVDASLQNCSNCQYLWDDGSTNPHRILDPEQAQEYFLSITHESGCDVKDTFNLEVASSPDGLDLGQDPITCFGDSDGAIQINGAIGGTPPYLYSFNNETYNSITQFNNLPSGTYKIKVEDINGCSFDTTLVLNMPEEPLVELGEDIEIKLGDSIQIQALVNLAVDTFNWMQPSMLSCTDCLTPFVRPFYTSTFSIEVKDENGCPAYDHKVIIVRRDDAVYIPNAFSPDGDGKNDFFTVYADPSVERITFLKLFDRWGNFLFEFEDFPPNVEHLGWNGKFQGKLMDPAVFVYWTEVEYIDGRKELFKGDVVLVN